MNRRITTVVAVGAAVLSVIGFGGGFGFGGSGGRPVVPDPGHVFSQDLRVLTTADAPAFYAFEQRARPAYRVVRFNPVSGRVEPVFRAPEDMLVFGLDVVERRPDGADVLVLAATRHPDRDRSGLYTVDLAESTPVPRHLAGDDRPQRYWAHPEVTDHGVAATVHDADTARSVIANLSRTGRLTGIHDDAMQPSVRSGKTAWLAVDPDSGRRRVVVGNDESSDADGSAVVAVDADLDFPLLTSDGSVWAAVLEPTDRVRGFLGRPAAAHGSHHRPSRWQRLRPAGDRPVSDPVIAYDAALLPGDVIVVAAADGLHLVDTTSSTTTKLAHSRAIRFVAG